MVKLGYKENKNIIISTNEKGYDNKEIKGFISTQTESSYINDKNNNSNIDLVTTAGHEASSYIDIKEGLDITKNRDDNNIYSDNFGKNLASYTNFALNITNQGSLADTNNHTKVKSLEAHLQLQKSNAEFARLDKGDGDNMPFVIIPIVAGLIGLEKSLNAPEDDTPLSTPLEDAERLGRDYVRKVVDNPKELAIGFDNAGAVTELLGVAVLNGKTPKAKITGTALITTGLVFGGLKEFLDPSSSEVNARNLQIDYFTQPLPNIIEAPTQLMLKKINEEVNKDEK